MKNYYQILQISENASPEIIEKAYRVLAKKYHPDVQPRDKLYWAEVNFKEITEAYTVLSNKDLKREYDMKLNAYNFQTQNYNFTQNYQQQNYNNSSSEPYEETTQTARSKSKSTKPKSALNSLNEELISSVKEIIASIPNLIREHSKKPQKERSESIKALILTLIIVSIIIFIFIKVPFLNKLLFP